MIRTVESMVDSRVIMVESGDSDDDDEDVFYPVHFVVKVRYVRVV